MQHCDRLSEIANEKSDVLVLGKGTASAVPPREVKMRALASEGLRQLQLDS
jgi:hypothetical protein